MAIFPTSAIPSAAGAGGYEIDNSLRFNDDDSAYLSWTPSSAGNKRTYTWSGWVKRSELGSDNTIFGAGNGGTIFDELRFGSDDKLDWYTYASVTYGQRKSTAVFRDTSAWYHIVAVYDSTDSTALDRMKLYVNGEQITDLDTTTNPDQHHQGNTNGTIIHAVGAVYAGQLYNPFDGYIAEVHFIDGQALTPSDFGETDATYGHWKPIEYTGTYGTNGFYLPFDNTGTIHAITANGNAQHSTAQSKIGASSLKFDGSGDYLSLSDHNNWDLLNEFTIEFWMNHNNITKDQEIIEHWNDIDNRWGIMWHPSTGLNFFRDKGGASYWSINVGSNPAVANNTWYHVAIVRQDDLYIIYKDGIAIKTKTMSVPDFNCGGMLNIGGMVNYPTAHRWIDGYLDEFRISNSARYTANFTPSTTAFEDDDNTLLLIHSDTTNGSTTFTDSSGVEGELGNDQSGNANHWTTNNIVASDQMLDSPTNNFPTLNPLAKDSNITLSEGNLKAYGDGTWTGGRATFAIPKTGKWYWEWCVGVTDTQYYNIGLDREGIDTPYYQWYKHAGTYEAAYDGTFMYGYSSQSGTTTAHSAGDVVGWTSDDGEIKVYLNNVLKITFSQNLSAIDNDYFPAYSSIYDGDVVANFGQDSSFAGNKTAQSNTDDNGYGDFYYSPPTGFNALCTANLPEPTVVPSEHFNTVLYTGNGSTQSITGVGFQPDMSWVKSRSGTTYHRVCDVVRGALKPLLPNSTLQELSNQFVSSFDSDGITVNDDSANNGWNNSSHNYVLWNWKANGTSVLNENGTLDSQVSANQDAGFSIVSYTGNGSAGATVGHGLSKAPEMVIVKSRSLGDNWVVQNSITGGQYRLVLNGTHASGLASSYWNNTDAGSSVFTLGYDNAVNYNNGTHIAYCFHSVEGYSKVGSYTGNGSTDGTFVYCGFKPAYVMVKRTDSSGYWALSDSERSPFNVMDDALYANVSNSESTPAQAIDYLSNGFKFRSTDSDSNSISGTHIYIAFAETPFKYTNAR